MAVLTLHPDGQGLIGAEVESLLQRLAHALGVVFARHHDAVDYDLKRRAGAGCVTVGLRVDYGAVAQ